SVTQTSDGIQVTGQGAGEDQVTKIYTGATSIRGDGGLADDSITIADNVKLPATLIGGPGNDTLQGGGGANTFVFFDGWAQDVVTGSITGTDTLDLSAVTHPLTITQTATGWLIQDDQGNKVTYTGTNIRRIIGGRSAFDQLIAYDRNNTWLLTGPGAGTLNTDLAFSNIESITGGGAADTFNFSTTVATITGTIDGGGGNDTFNFPARSAPTIS